MSKCDICGSVSGNAWDQTHDTRFHALHEKVESLEELCIDLTRLVTKGKAAGSATEEGPAVCARCGHSLYEHGFGPCDAKRGGESVCDCEDWVHPSAAVDVPAEGPFSGPESEIRALHGFLQDIAATVGLGPDIESYDDVCRAVEKLSAGSAPAEPDWKAIADRLAEFCPTTRFWNNQRVGWSEARDALAAYHAAGGKVRT